MKISRAILCVLLVLLLVPISAQSPADRRTSGPADCRFELPIAWDAAQTGQAKPTNVTWLGHCQAGFADGLGVLRTHLPNDPDSAYATYAGRLTAGRLTLGVLTSKGQDTAGQWYNGAPAAVPAGAISRNSTMLAYRAGADGADAAIKRATAQADTTAARSYTQLAHRLRAQADGKAPN